MKRVVLCFLLLSVIFIGCKKDEEKLPKLQVQITSEETNINYSEFKVIVADLKTQETYEANANENGIAEFKLPNGQYNIVVENLKDGVSTLYGTKENFTLSADETVEIKVQPIIEALDKTFVLDELYFNGTKNGDYGYTYYEQYFTIRNISDRPLYADGLSFGVCGDFNTLEEKNKMNKLLGQDIVALSQVYTIPGDGHTYKVNPNESLVIARSAINHNDDGTKKNSLDLSGANFEIYVPDQYSMTTDNPDVPDLIVNYTAFQAFQWQYTGATPLILFRLDQDVNTFIEQNKESFPNPASMGFMDHDCVKLPAKYIIDGVETGSTDGFYHKTLPVSVDKTKFTIPGSGMVGTGFDGHFIKRKEITDNKGKPTVQDTDDSANDYELLTGGQKSYPKN